MIKYFLSLFLLYFIHVLSHMFSIKIINTPIYNSIPIIKLHSIVCLENIINKNDDVFFVDFSPFEDISRPDVILKLFQGKKIQGKIRVFCFSKEFSKYIFTENNIFENLDTQISNENIKKLENIDADIVNIITSWEPSFQVYNRNCRHFSDYLQKKYILSKVQHF